MLLFHESLAPNCSEGPAQGTVSVASVSLCDGGKLVERLLCVWLVCGNEIGMCLLHSFECEDCYTFILVVVPSSAVK